MYNNINLSEKLDFYLYLTTKSAKACLSQEKFDMYHMISKILFSYI